ncbi:juvenile hormone acid O-methyltransferase [Papilio machaon]|uniref:juvenile hormone acid O-methyltransferase n=1 Tax=Papilio machaon TaxID=76193 RepID=UPI001E664C18|nr:juvenile hormone acid O-methyltransferase [Papilio machaon]
MNDDAELYKKSNTLQKRDAVECLEEYAIKIKWRNYNDRIIDIGCGDGSVTSNILRRYLPNNYGRLIGCDISKNMVQHANRHHANNRNCFRVMDIESELPRDLRECFDHAFSFYTLHWIKRQECAFRNIFDLLVEGGDCLLIFLGHMPVFDVYRVLARSARWRPWLHDVDRFVSPYHDTQEPEKKIRVMMEEIGFREVEVKRKERSFIYDSIEAVKKAVSAVNPFKIPRDLQEEFMEDYLAVVRDMRLIDRVNNNTDSLSVRANYSLLIAFGRK